MLTALRLTVRSTRLLYFGLAVVDSLICPEPCASRPVQKIG